MKKIKNLLRRIYTINIIYSNNIIFIHRKNTKNIGDLNCCPNKYFDELSKYKSIDIMDLQNINIKIKNKILIVGGGGLFQPYFEDAIKTLEKLSLENKIIYWGTGIDKNIQGETINLDFLNKSSLIGIRDKNTKYDFVPCPSCMSKLFDKYSNAKKSNKIIFYLHKDYTKSYINHIKEFPLITNSDKKTFEEIIKYLSSSDVIITNSYHGAYWGCLLNRKVIVLPWIDEKGRKWLPYKIKQIPFQYSFCENINDINNFINRDINNTEALNFARTKNKIFFNKVMNFIKTYN